MAEGYAPRFTKCIMPAFRLDVLKMGEVRCRISTSGSLLVL